MLHVKSTIIYNIKKHINMDIAKSITGVLLKKPEEKKKNTYIFIAHQDKHLLPTITQYKKVAK